MPAHTMWVTREEKPSTILPSYKICEWHYQPVRHSVSTGSVVMTITELASCLQMGFGLVPQEGIHIWFSKPGQNPTVEDVIASLLWGGTATIVLLNEHIAKLSWKYLDLHPQISDALSLGQQSYCLHWIVANAETYNWSECGDQVMAEHSQL